jgi:histone H3/H4
MSKAPVTKKTTILVKQKMKEFSKGFQISEDAWVCMKDHIEMFFERNMKSICDIARSKNRKTVFEEDVICFFGCPDKEDLRL